MYQNPSTLYVTRLDSIAGAATPWRKVADLGDAVTQFQWPRPVVSLALEFVLDATIYRPCGAIALTPTR
jgi:hypothetical protein